MGLRLTLKPGHRVVLNGAIVRNAGSSRMVLEVENRSDVLRGEEIISQSQATTPVRRLAYVIQMALASRDHRDSLLPEIHERLDRIEGVLSDGMAPALRSARQRVGAGEFYEALKCLEPVMGHEERLLRIASRRATPSPEGALAEEA